MPTILERWWITEAELTRIVDANPSLRGFLLGYIGEYKARAYFDHHENITNLIKYDDHDRKNKGDISFRYKGKEFRVEVKSLQTSSVVRMGPDRWKGKFQCDASDRREILLPNGHRVNTTCLVAGEFDLVAVNLFSFGDQWRFAFARNSDLPHPGRQARNMTAEDREYLIKTLIGVTWPPQAPFTTDVYSLLDRML